MPQPVTASTSSNASNDTSASANRFRDSASSFQDTLSRVQDSQSPNSNATNAPGQQPVPSGTQKKTGKDDRQKSASLAESANKQDKPAKSDKAPAKTDGQNSDGKGRQPPPQKQQHEPQPGASTAQPPVMPPPPVPATPQPSSLKSDQRKTPQTQRPQAEAIVPTPDSGNNARASATDQDAQPGDLSQSAPASPTSAQDLQSQQNPQEVTADADKAANPRPDLRANVPGDLPKSNKSNKQAPADLPPAPDPSASTNSANVLPNAGPATDPAPPATKSSPDDILAKIGMTSSVLQTHTAATDPHASTAAPAKAVALPPEAQFAEANHPKLIEAIHGRLLPDGGTMTLRLDPPELGAMNVRVEVRDGVINASFEASSDQTARLLSHSLGDLKTALEAQGVSVEKLHVSQAPKDQSSQNQSRQDSDRGAQDRSTQQEQQRREMMRRMWRRLMKAQDPLDLVA